MYTGGLRWLNIYNAFRYSPWSLDIEHNEVLSACKELGIPIAAYSPLGRGFLTGQIRSPDDLPEGDHRKQLDRFKVSFSQPYAHHLN
jgi:aryl-alcohol dehydrogenase-like predicted oxidoreductase